MTILRRAGLRSRLAGAMAAVAVLSVALATLSANHGLQSEIRRSATYRLQSTAMHVSALAADLQASGASNDAVAKELRHVAAIDGLLIAIHDVDGRSVAGSAALGGRKGASAEIVVRGRTTGTVTVVPANRAAFEKADQALLDRLNRLHVLAGVIAGVLALCAALLLSIPLTRPLRRITEGAHRMERGELDVRVLPNGGAELESLARALNQLASTLELEEELRRDATADLAHELRTPVTGLITRIEAAQDDVMADPAANLAAMHGEALRLARLTDDLKQLSDAQKPGLLLKKQRVDLAEIAAERANAINHIFSDKNIEFDRDLDAAPMDGDSARLGQMLDNLLSNALRYTDSGGRVALLTFAVGGESVLQVADTGMGIAPDELDHVFDRFWRSDKSRARIHGGAGIGLAIVRELVRAHDGRIDVESALGEGTTFTARFPAAQHGGS